MWGMNGWSHLGIYIVSLMYTERKFPPPVRGAWAVCMGDALDAAPGWGQLGMTQTRDAIRTLIKPRCDLLLSPADRPQWFQGIGVYFKSEMGSERYKC